MSYSSNISPGSANNEAYNLIKKLFIFIAVAGELALKICQRYEMSNDCAMA